MNFVLLVGGAALVVVVAELAFDAGYKAGSRQSRRQGAEALRQAHVDTFGTGAGVPPVYEAWERAQASSRRAWHAARAHYHNGPFESCASDICRGVRPVPHG